MSGPASIAPRMRSSCCSASDSPGDNAAGRPSPCFRRHRARFAGAVVAAELPSAPPNSSHTDGTAPWPRVAAGAAACIGAAVAGGRIALRPPPRALRRVCGASPAATGASAGLRRSGGVPFDPLLVASGSSEPVCAADAWSGMQRHVAQRSSVLYTRHLHTLL